MSRVRTPVGSLRWEWLKNHSLFSFRAYWLGGERSSCEEIHSLLFPCINYCDFENPHKHWECLWASWALLWHLVSGGVEWLIIVVLTWVSFMLKWVKQIGIEISYIPRDLITVIFYYQIPERKTTDKPHKYGISIFI